MLRRVASRVSMRSRERKLDLLLELFEPGPETTVVDVGVTDAPFGGGSSDNFFEALYPWPDRITAVGHTELDRFTAAFPEVRAVRADGRDLPFSDGEFDLGFSNAVVEHVAGGRTANGVSCTSSAGSRQRVRDDTEPLVPARGAHAAAVRALAAGRCAATRDSGSTTCSIRSVRRSSRRSFLTACGYSTGHDADRGRFRVKRSVVALHVLIVGLALHNLVMAQLWRAGVRGTALTIVSAWKDVLLLVALVLVVRERRRLPFDGRLTDWLALAFGALVVLYGLLPQSWLGGGATHRGVLYAARHDLLPVAAYFLGRGLQLTDRERSRLCHTVLATAAFVAAFGLIDVYAVPLSFWRPAAGWFRDQLGLVYSAGTSGLPENFVYNAGNGVVFRRLTSTFLSPLATSYLLVVALFFIPLRRRWGPPLALLIFAALLWTHTRSALLVLVVVLVLRAIVRRRPRALIWAAAVAVIGLAFVQGYDHFGPRTHFTAKELRVQEQIAHSTRGRRTTRRAPTSRRPASISRRCATAGARSCTTPGGSGSATPASPPRGRTSP